MKRTSLPVLRSLLAYAMAVHCVTAFAEDGPPELAGARSDYEARLAVPRAKLEHAVKTRTTRYIADLKEMEDRNTASGQLDAVVAIRAEREAYEKGSRTNGFAAGDAKVPAAARQLRAVFEGDVARARAAVAPEGRVIASGYVKALGDLERKLTNQNSIPAAQAVRKAREEMQTESLDPLNPPTSGLIGDWQQPASAPRNSRTGKVFSFRRDGIWRNSANETGTWEWTDRAKRKIMFRWKEKPWNDGFTLSADGKRLVGNDNQSNPLVMERLP